MFSRVFLVSRHSVFRLSKSQEISQNRRLRDKVWADANTVRDIEYGRDVQISTVQLVAKAVGLRPDYVEEAV